MPSGKTEAVRFCAACGSRVFTEASPERITLRPGTLDDASWVTPVAQYWTRSAHAWALFDGLLSYESQSEDYADVAKAWLTVGLRFVVSTPGGASTGEPPS
jgi:hypothetical protein